MDLRYCGLAARIPHAVQVALAQLVGTSIRVFVIIAVVMRAPPLQGQLFTAGPYIYGHVTNMRNKLSIASALLKGARKRRYF